MYSIYVIYEEGKGLGIAPDSSYSLTRELPQLNREELELRIRRVRKEERSITRNIGNLLKHIWIKDLEKPTKP